MIPAFSITCFHALCWKLESSQVSVNRARWKLEKTAREKTSYRSCWNIPFVCDEICSPFIMRWVMRGSKALRFVTLYRTWSTAEGKTSFWRYQHNVSGEEENQQKIIKLQVIHFFIRVLWPFIFAIELRSWKLFVSFREYVKVWKSKKIIRRSCAIKYLT